MCTWPTSTVHSRCWARSRKTGPRYLRSSAYRALRRYLGIQTTWYLHSHLVWATLSLSSMEASWDWVSFERFTAQEAFVFSRNCQTLGVPRQSRGATQFT